MWLLKIALNSTGKNERDNSKIQQCYLISAHEIWTCLKDKVWHWFNYLKWNCHDGKTIVFQLCPPPRSQGVTVCLYLDNSEAEVGRVWVCLLKNGSRGRALRALTTLLTSATCDVLSAVPANMCVCVCVGYMHEEQGVRVV